jgi:hypothetical protein
MPRSQILHSKTTGVKFNRTRIVSCELVNRKKVMNHLRSNKDTGKTKRTRTRTHGGDRGQDPPPTMMEEGQEEGGGRAEESILASGVVWKEVP